MINCRSDTHKYTVVDADTSKCSRLNVLELFPLFLSVISEMMSSRVSSAGQMFTDAARGRLKHKYSTHL